LRIVFFGLGSIGNRHLRLLEKVKKADIFAFKREKTEETGIKSLYSWGEVEGAKIDVAFITNPTEYHIKTAWQCAIRDIPFFLEKPISHNCDGLATLLKEVEKRGLVTYVAYPMRFHKTIWNLRNGSIRPSNRLVVCRSNAKKWPSKRGLNSVMFELSHEIDYASYIWGDIVEIGGTLGVMDTWANLDLTHEDGNHTGAFLDMASPFEERTVAGHSILVGDNIYSRQLRYFFDNLSNNRMMNNLVDASRLFEKIVHFQEGK